MPKLSDEQLDAIERYARPLPAEDREPFIQGILSALERVPLITPAVLQRMCAGFQHRFRRRAVGLDSRKPAGLLSIPKRKGRAPGTQFLERRGYHGGWR